MDRGEAEREAAAVRICLQLKKTPSEIIAPKNHKIDAATKPIQQINATASGTIRRTNKNGLAAMNRTVNRNAVHLHAWGASPAPEFAMGPTIGPASTAALI